MGRAKRGVAYFASKKEVSSTVAKDAYFVDTGKECVAGTGRAYFAEAGQTAQGEQASHLPENETMGKKSLELGQLLQLDQPLELSAERSSAKASQLAFFATLSPATKGDEEEEEEQQQEGQEEEDRALMYFGTLEDLWSWPARVGETEAPTEEQAPTEETMSQERAPRYPTEETFNPARRTFFPTEEEYKPPRQSVFFPTE